MESDTQDTEARKQSADQGVGAPEWQRAHVELVRLARARAGLDSEEGRWLLAARRLGVHRRLGYGSFLEYIERLFGYSPRFILERLRVAEALATLPALNEALSGGVLTWSSARELVRVATPRTEQEWLAAATGKSVHEIERLVSGHRPGDLPTDPSDPTARRHIVRLDLSAEAFASFSEAMARLRRDAGGPLDDDAAILMMARAVLAGPADTRRASYQISLTVCENCRRAQQRGRGQLVPVGSEVLEMAECDAQLIPTTHVGGERARSSKRGPIRATQTIRPRLRRTVMARDGQRCVVPGCRHSTFIDVHHIDLRRDGGDDRADNLICLCGGHHRALHRGELRIEGTVSTGLTFRHADGTPYGGSVSPGDAGLRSAAFRALRGLGFPDRDARRALERASTHVGEHASIDVLLRAVLGVPQDQP